MSIEKMASQFVNKINAPITVSVNQISRAQQKELIQHAARIRALVKRTNSDLQEMARYLAEAKEILTRSPTNKKLPTKEWNDWLSREVSGLSREAANSLVKIHHAFKDADLKGLPISKGALSLLSSGYVPDSTRQKAITRAREGNYIGEVEARRLARLHKSPETDTAFFRDCAERFRQDFAKWLDSKGIEYVADVPTPIGTIHFETADAFYEIEGNYCGLNESLRVIGKMLLIRKMSGDSKRPVVVGGKGADFERYAHHFAQVGIELKLMPKQVLKFL